MKDFKQVNHYINKLINTWHKNKVIKIKKLKKSIGMVTGKEKGNTGWGWSPDLHTGNDKTKLEPEFHATLEENEQEALVTHAIYT